MLLSSNVLKQTGAYLSVREDLFGASIWRYEQDLVRSAEV